MSKVLWLKMSQIPNDAKKKKVTFGQRWRNFGFTNSNCFIVLRSFVMAMHDLPVGQSYFFYIIVQEKSITDAARNIYDWINLADKNYHMTFLPKDLSEMSLCYPQLRKMFTDINVHRLCFSHGNSLYINLIFLQWFDWLISLTNHCPHKCHVMIKS